MPATNVYGYGWFEGSSDFLESRRQPPIMTGFSQASADPPDYPDDAFVVEVRRPTGNVF